MVRRRLGSIMELLAQRVVIMMVSTHHATHHQEV
jgi:hypothetical protein